MPVKKFRKDIEIIDAGIIKLLKKRMQTSEKIGRYKKQHSMPIIDMKREKEHCRQLDGMAKKLNLSRKMVKNVFREIIRESRKVQQRGR